MSNQKNQIINVGNRCSFVLKFCVKMALFCVKIAPVGPSVFNTKNGILTQNTSPGAWSITRLLRWCQGAATNEVTVVRLAGASTWLRLGTAAARNAVPAPVSLCAAATCKGPNPGRGDAAPKPASRPRRQRLIAAALDDARFCWRLHAAAAPRGCSQERPTLLQSRVAVAA